MTKTVDWAKKELELAGYSLDGEEGPNKWIAENLLELLEVLSTQGHSGSSIHYLVHLFSRLALWKPISPLTGNDDEWMKIGGNSWQNKRCSAVFKTKDRPAYYINGIVFWEWFSSPDIDDGKPFKSYYTSGQSFVDIEFPWVEPEKPEYVFVPTPEFPSEYLYH